MATLTLAAALAMTTGSALGDAPRAQTPVAGIEQAEAPSWHLGSWRREFDLQGEVAGTADGFGLDLRLGGCVGLGPLCVGPALQYQQTTAAASSSRLGGDALFVAQLPLRFGKVLVTPSLGVGAGWWRTYHVASPQQTVPQFSCGGPVPGGTSTDCQFSNTAIVPPDQNTFGLRVDGGLTIGIPVRQNWSLTGHLGVTLAPFAHTDPLVSAPLSSTEALLAGEPLFIARMGFGAEWVTP